MPRLLLVDDNPSIHKIAETLLAPTSIELVCVESAADALKRIEAGQHFDVALVDIAMAGMDGWELLACLRAHPATVTMPIAMMAGVLDSVDPQRLEQAPIQGFLKKPVELRDLGDRVKKLLETPVPLPPPAPVVETQLPPPPATQTHSAFATMPATKLSDLPEFRAAAQLEDDLLELGEADLLPESDSPSGLGSDLFEGGEPELAEITTEEPLDLEEFDLDGLKGLTLEPIPAEGVPEGEPTLESPLDFPEPQVTGHLPTELAEPASDLPVFDDLPDLGPSLDLEPMPNPEAEHPEPAQASSGELAENVLDFDWVDDSEALLKVDPLPEKAPEVGMLAPSEAPAAVPSTEMVAPPVSAAPVVPLAPVVEGGRVATDAKALVEALKADPEALQALAKAVVAQLGDQVLKDIAWELMPDLADRLGRH